MTALSASGERTCLDWAQVLGLVPYSLGFAPGGSLVVMGYAGPRLVGMIRADLAAEPGGTRGRMSRVLAGGRPLGLDAAAAAGFGPDPLAGPACAAAAAAVRDAGLQLLDSAWVEDGRFWSYLAGGQAAGTAVRPPPADLAACMRPVLPSRQALADSLAPACGTAAAAVAAAADGARRRLAGLARAPGMSRRAVARSGAAAVSQAIAACHAGGPAAGPDEVAWLTVLLGKGSVLRDVAGAALTDPARQRAHERLWRQLTVLAPPGWVPGPAAMLALTALQSGDGILAGLAADRALSDGRAPREAPGRALAEALRGAAARGLALPGYEASASPRVTELRAGPAARRRAVMPEAFGPEAG